MCVFGLKYNFLMSCPQWDIMVLTGVLTTNQKLGVVQNFFTNVLDPKNGL
ncbi:hypothetical protein HanXRQr2_Chr01g0024431 [Helianthus annuus]|uniref:Uncharacterized protein n=1 Tax=Helianthus annuus TaxID=4232 RepID=A0A9K3JV78_HELAN|nr:hypothetical protein HanXRQr2_Chr01g0024431 [Helianthus annuus]